MFFDVLCEHDPPGLEPGDVFEESSLRIQCWVKQIAAYDPEQAAMKAERFLTEQRGFRNIKVKRWRYTRRPADQKGVTPTDGQLLT